MENILEGHVRENFGSRVTAQLRKEGNIPGVLYGKGSETAHFYVESKKLDEILRHAERIINVKVGKSKAVPTLIKDIQYDGISGAILHVDAHIVKLDEKLEVRVEVELMGTELAPGVQDGGNLEIYVHEVNVSCFPGNIPEKYEIDLTEMAIGDSKKIADIPAFEGVEVLDDPEDLVVAILEPVDVEAETDIEASLQELDEAEPTVQKQKEPAEGEADGDANAGKKD